MPAGQGGAQCQAPPADAVAVELNLVAVNPQAPGNLQVAAAGVVPDGGVVNFTAGVNNSNAVPVAVTPRPEADSGPGGVVEASNNAGGGDVHVRGVALGYYTTAGSDEVQDGPQNVTVGGVGFVAVPPCAVFDTRTGAGEFDGPLAGGASQAFRVTGAVAAAQGGAECAAPPEGAVAVHLNLVAVDAQGTGNLQIAPAGVADGGVVNFVAGVDNANALPVAVSDGGVEVTNNTGGGDVDVRGVVLGYYVPSDTAPPIV